MEKTPAKGRGRPPRGDAMKERIFVLTSPETRQKLEESRELSGKTTSDLVRIGLEWAYAVLTGEPPEALARLEAQLRTSKAEQEEQKEREASPPTSPNKEGSAREAQTGTLSPKPEEPGPKEAPKKPLPSHLL